MFLICGNVLRNGNIEDTIVKLNINVKSVNFVGSYYMLLPRLLLSVDVLHDFIDILQLYT
jgi:hypothetical protein